MKHCGEAEHAKPHSCQHSARRSWSGFSTLREAATARPTGDRTTMKRGYRNAIRKSLINQGCSGYLRPRGMGVVRRDHAWE